MKNELKLGIAEQLTEMIEITELYQSVMAFHGREKQRNLDSQTMQSELVPMQNSIKKSLAATSKEAISEIEKDEISKCAEHCKVLTERIGQFVRNDLDIDQVLMHLKVFKAFVEGLVENDEQLHTKATGQGSAAKQGKAASTGSGKADQDQAKGFTPGDNQQGRKRTNDRKGQ